MSFSTSPLVPEQTLPVDEDAWRAGAQRVFGAVTDALPQVPSAEPLVPDAPTPQPGETTMPAAAGTAVVGTLDGVEGTLLVVMGTDLLEALQGTPFGDVEPAQALQPALEALAAGLGGRLAGAAAAVPVEDCLGVLTGNVTVYVPLLAGETTSALIAVSLVEAVSAPAEPAGAPAAGAAGPAGGAAAGGLAGSAPAGSAAPAGAPGARNGAWGLDMLRDVEMEVTCELGRTRMTVRQLLALAPGDVVELDRLAGSPADLLVNGTLLARGEVVVVDESFGLRITEIVTRDAT